MGYKDVVIKPFNFKEHVKLVGFVDTLSAVVPYLRDPEQKEKYLNYLKEQGNGQTMEFDWNAWIVTAKK